MASHPSHDQNLTRNTLFDVSHVTALVTGGGSGIGLMITQALVGNGAKVYITGRREEALQTVVEKHNKGPGKIIALPGDISVKDDVLRLAKEMEKNEPNGIQLLVNNAGVARDDNTRMSKNSPPDWADAKAVSEHFLATEMSQWEETFQINVFAQYFMSMAFLPLLQKGHRMDETGASSSIVNVSSISGAMKGTSGGQPAYATSKAAFTHLTRMLATTFIETKVRVNCIAPGLFPSEMTAGSSGDDQKSELEPGSGNPARRKGSDADMAATILFLASKGAAFYNHQILYPDGGATLYQPAAN